MTDTTPLRQRHCVPCEGGEEPLGHDEVQELMQNITNWSVVDDKAIEKDFAFKNFKEAFEFVNKIGAIAEKEGHHPDIFLHNWKKVKITLTTHAIKGLSYNDFILAAKTDEL